MYILDPYDDCMSAPCGNGTACIDKINSYKCECEIGFRGKDCKTGKL